MSFKDSITLLLINPWIYDFAAYDLWSKPLGFLYLASLLKKARVEIFLIDCLDRCHWSLEKGEREDKVFGCGKYYVEEIPKPAELGFVPRRYKRYGIPVDAFIQDIRSTPTPDAILITSRMTYWYPAVVDTIKICKEEHPGVPVILGGTYPTLMPDHAISTTGADIVIGGEGEDKILPVVSEVIGKEIFHPLEVSMFDLDTLPYPALDLYPQLLYAPIQTSRGCPYRCAYCAARKISPAYRRRDPEKTANEILYWEKEKGIQDFAFYDDALLVDAEHNFLPLLNFYLSKGGKARFHTPNGLDCAGVSQDVADMMYRAGFKTLRLSLETASRERLEVLNRRVDSVDKLEQAIMYLHNAGYKPDEIGVYLLTGLPGQHLEEIKASIEIVLNLGGNPRLGEYSPIPGTRIWGDAVDAIKSVDISNEPLYHNNSVFYLLLNEFKDNPMPQLRNYIYKALAG